MKTKIYIQKGVFAGQTFSGHNSESIARRIYGRKAVIRWDNDPNSPSDGTIGIPTPYGLKVRAVFRFDN